MRIDFRRTQPVETLPMKAMVMVMVMVGVAAPPSR
jgi:hypothetical protein